jgi:hypothetical protein
MLRLPMVDPLVPLTKRQKIIAGSPSVNGMFLIRPTTSSKLGRSNGIIG